MAIANKELHEIITVYNPTLEAYQEITIEAFKLQLQSLGLTEDEIKKKIKAMRAKQKLEA